jgi:phenylpropionate dioxygenase-like ring-hydroxylating dioxygenase large terminal subunit
MAGWIPIALGKDIPAETTRSAVVEDHELVIWRGADGTTQVWEDRCPHRGMRLSFGFVRDNALNCLYHGWQYGAGSQCLRIPAHPDLNVPPTIRAKAFASMETGGMIWTQLEPLREAPAPDLPGNAAPLLTLAVEAEPEAIHAALGQTLHAAGAYHIVVEHAEGVLHIGWHRVRAGRTMLHTLIEGDGRMHAVRWLRTIRSLAEQGVAA